MLPRKPVIQQGGLPRRDTNHGINFRINDPSLVIGEVQYIWNGKKGDPGLDGNSRSAAGGISANSPISGSPHKVSRWRTRSVPECL
jgi:hypothetical protein